MFFPCPACQGSVPETALVCPACGKSFVVDATAPAPGGGAPFLPYAPPAAPFPSARGGYDPEAIKDGRDAIGFAVGALFCFAPLAFYALKVASRAQERAARTGTLTPPSAQTARTISYIAIVLWIVGIAFRVAMRTHR